MTLTVALAAGSFLVLMALSVLLVHPDLSTLARLFGDRQSAGDQQNQHVKSALYLAAFAVVLPLSLVVMPKIADVIAAGPNHHALSGLAQLLVATLAAAIIAVKVSGHLPWGDGLAVLLLSTGIWLAGAIAAIARTMRTRPWSPLLRLTNQPGTTALTCVLVFGVLLSVSPHSSGYLLPLAVGASVSAGLLVVRSRWRAPNVSSRWGGLGDALIIVVLVLAVPDIVIFTTSGALPNPYFPPGIIQFHHDFLLGPTNQLLGGGALLVDDPVSQYGVGSIYFLAAWFHLAPIGYGTYGALDGILTALFYAAALAVLRLAGASRILAASTIAVAVVALVYNMHYSVGALPQEGPLRFGLPMALILAAVVAARWPHRGRVATLAALAVIAVSSIWAFEAFIYTAATFTAILAARALLRPAGERRRWCAREAAFAVGACLGAHLTLAGATLVASGHLPAWGRYLAIVRSFLGGSAGEIVYGFAPWSPGLALGGLYLTSAAAIVLVLRRRPEVFARNPPALVAVTGATVYGIALFSYADNRSATYVLCYVALPAFVAAGIWLSTLLGSRSEAPPRVRLVALTAAMAVTVLLVAAAWPSAGSHFSHSALANAYPGGGLPAAVQRLWDAPPIDPRAPEGDRLLARYMPRQRHVLVLLLPDMVDLGTEILIRSHRANALPFGDPKADAFVPAVTLPVLGRSVGQLRPRTRLLINDAAVRVLDPTPRRLVRTPGQVATPDPTRAFLVEVLKEIRRRFAVRIIHRTASGLAVGELTPRS